MKYIKIVNDGEIDISALLLIGASTKRNDETKIGFFGSGLKYSLSLLLRNKVMPLIFSGTRKVEIATEKILFRNQEFDQIIIDGNKTSLTTQMGPDWEPWFAIREIYCNALDEGNGKLEMCDITIPEEGKTSIFIENTSIFDELIFNWNKYFTNKRQDLVISYESNRAFFGSENVVIYRKGVRAYSINKPCLYHYDLNDVTVNESRVLNSIFDAEIKITRLLAQQATKEIIKNIFDNYRGMYEAEIYWSTSNPPCFNTNWLEVLGGRKIVLHDVAGNFVNDLSRGAVTLPNNLARSLKAHFKDKVIIAGQSDDYANHFEVELTPKHLFFIEQAKEFLNQAGIKIDYQIKPVVFEDTMIFGKAENEIIYIADECFNHGKRKVVETILEEYVHLKYEVADKSREMQDVLFNMLVGCYEEKNNVYL